MPAVFISTSIISISLPHSILSPQHTRSCLEWPHFWNSAFKPRTSQRTGERSLTPHLISAEELGQAFLGIFFRGKTQKLHFSIPNVMWHSLEDSAWGKIPEDSLAVVVILFSAVTLAWACALCCRNCWINFSDKERPVPSYLFKNNSQESQMGRIGKNLSHRRTQSQVLL